ncbi:hypothetical protein GGR58DRAFT_241194 [Xylaria digitata]|nr:hypothetical protein GGR58DRAFT_241194 [Xylaria digitata]
MILFFIFCPLAYPPINTARVQIIEAHSQDLKLGLLIQERRVRLHPPILQAVLYDLAEKRNDRKNLPTLTR